MKMKAVPLLLNPPWPARWGGITRIMSRTVWKERVEWEEEEASGNSRTDGGQVREEGDKRNKLALRE